MLESEYLRGAISELNTQLYQLSERKAQLLAQAAGEPDSAHCKSGSYAAYLSMMAKKRDPVTGARVVYQGEPGAYSEMAARNFFGPEVSARGLYQFADTFLALSRGEADYAVLPIENTSTGAIRQVYDLLEQYHYFFVGETTVAVRHALMALPGVKESEITTVFSHEQGLFQCDRFLSGHSEWKTVAQADTAGSAKLVAELGDPHCAAICSTRAAELYGLEILREEINANSANTTRFVVVSPLPELRLGRNKVCISLTTAHNSGALHNVLTVFAVHRINLVRLESRPIPEHNWEYMFFIEFTGDLESAEIDAVIHEISLLAGDLRVLGNFHSDM